jgi:hypothetical protein
MVKLVSFALAVDEHGRAGGDVDLEPHGRLAHRETEDVAVERRRLGDVVHREAAEAAQGGEHAGSPS